MIKLTSLIISEGFILGLLVVTIIALASRNLLPQQTTKVFVPAVEVAKKPSVAKWTPDLSAKSNTKTIAQWKSIALSSSEMKEMPTRTRTPDVIPPKPPYIRSSGQ